MTGNAVPTVQTDNEKTRVTEWRFAPGAPTGYHVHEYDDVIVPITTETLVLTDTDGDVTHAERQARGTYFSRGARGA